MLPDWLILLWFLSLIFTPLLSKGIPSSAYICFGLLEVFMWWYLTLSQLKSACCSHSFVSSGQMFATCKGFTIFWWMPRWMNHLMFHGYCTSAPWVPRSYKRIRTTFCREQKDSLGRILRFWVSLLKVKNAHYIWKSSLKNFAVRLNNTCSWALLLKKMSALRGIKWA